MPLLPDDGPSDTGGLRFGLVNNMPDAALEATESQFRALIDAASGEKPVRLSLFSIPEVTRSERAQAHIERWYQPIDKLWNTGVDALIVTGTEPRAADLRDEPYWDTLTKLVDWADANTISTVWSCLAAHTAVQYLDGVRRHRLAEKCSGIFDCEKVAAHPLTMGLPWCIPVPHSRLNELQSDELVEAGYSVLTESPEAGVDVFVKRQRSMFVFFQGHPEYDTASLLGEYRRDVARFLRGEREAYPDMPRHYFDSAVGRLLATFQQEAITDRHEDLLAKFPAAAAEESLSASWRAPAHRLYRNWIAYIHARKSRQMVAAIFGNVLQLRANVLRAGSRRAPTAVPLRTRTGTLSKVKSGN